MIILLDEGNIWEEKRNMQPLNNNVMPNNETIGFTTDDINPKSLKDGCKDIGCRLRGKIKLTPEQFILRAK